MTIDFNQSFVMAKKENNLSCQNSCNNCLFYYHSLFWAIMVGIGLYKVRHIQLWFHKYRELRILWELSDEPLIPAIAWDSHKNIL